MLFILWLLFNDIEAQKPSFNDACLSLANNYTYGPPYNVGTYNCVAWADKATVKLFLQCLIFVSIANMELLHFNCTVDS